MIRVVGSGGTVDDHDFGDGEVAAVSSGLYRAPRHPVAEFFTLDPARYFPGNIPRLARTVHVPAKSYKVGVDPFRTERMPDAALLIECAAHKRLWDTGWADWPNVRVWDICEGERPAFDSGPIMLPVPNSMLFVVQGLAQLGYREFLFVGCDFNDYGERIYRTLRSWFPVAADAGLLWAVADARSRLSEFMPVMEARCKPSQRLSLAS